MSIINMMEISTSHITKDAIDFLENEEKIIDNGMIVYKKETYGWFIWISDKFERDYVDKEIPESLWKCMTFAHKNSCQYLCLDCDAEVIDELPQYDW